MTDDAQKQGSGYVPALDGLRAIAVGGVFLLHLAAAYFPGGAFGVDVFFVLSAFLITGLLLKEVDATGRVDFPAFYWRRAFRLLPALLVWIVLASTTAVLAGQAAKVPWSAAGALFYFSDFLQAWTDWVATAFDQAWSLSVEEQFYFIWPALLVLVILRATPRAQRWFLSLSVVAAAAFAFTDPNYFLPTAHLLPLVIGCWAAEQRARGCSPWVGTVARLRWVGIPALLVFVVAALILPPTPVDHVVFLVVAVASTVVVLNVTSGERTVAARILGSPVPRWLGARSYGIYLYGLTLMQLVPLLTGLRLTYAAPVDVVLTLVVVAVSYRYLESPVRRWGRRWLSRKSDRRPDAATA
ncbi:hypothetical protein LK09_03235 [Microbacterium mangrovi]|uniref:Acyltransferase 3 domain-containing protein n=1 Tax=Microbacterium mangrovi TaxID=1348253 RepID=A0A0B2A744_9MICO|nr:acyltransferase [Microbacterium mangrovi]KHK99309.1 hypothetical protein LK09_03235 [Microbacterium mangrovi]